MNIHETKFKYDDEDPAGYRSAVAEVGREAGGREESVRLFEVPPGQHLSPYHYEYVEEWLLVLEGQVESRTPDGTKTLAAGELICYPSGPEGVHQVSNRTGDTAARVLMWSSARLPAVAVYPDSDKIAVWPPNDVDEVMLHRSDGHVGYYEGEPVG